MHRQGRNTVEGRKADRFGVLRGHDGNLRDVGHGLAPRLWGATRNGIGQKKGPQREAAVPGESDQAACWSSSPESATLSSFAGVSSGAAVGEPNRMTSGTQARAASRSSASMGSEPPKIFSAEVARSCFFDAPLRLDVYMPPIPLRWVR